MIASVDGLTGSDRHGGDGHKNRLGFLDGVLWDRRDRERGCGIVEHAHSGEVEGGKNDVVPRRVPMDVEAEARVHQRRVRRGGALSGVGRCVEWDGEVR